MNQHRLWHYNAFGDTTGLNKKDLMEAVEGYLKEKEWHSALGCLNALEEINTRMSSQEKVAYHLYRAVSFVGLSQNAQGCYKQTYERVAEEHLACCTAVLGEDNIRLSVTLG